MNSNAKEQSDVEARPRGLQRKVISAARSLDAFVCGPLLVGFIPDPSPLTPHPSSTVHFAFSVAGGPFFTPQKNQKNRPQMEKCRDWKGSPD